MGRPKGSGALSSRSYKNLAAAMEDLAIQDPDTPRRRSLGSQGGASVDPERKREYMRDLQRRHRARNAGRTVSCMLSIEAAAAMVYLQRQWGFKTNKEAAEVAMRFLAWETRKGLARIDLEPPDDPT